MSTLNTAAQNGVPQVIIRTNTRVMGGIRKVLKFTSLCLSHIIYAEKRIIIRNIVTSFIYDS